MMFFNGYDGRSYPVARIRSISGQGRDVSIGGGRGTLFTVYLERDEEVSIYAKTRDRLLDTGEIIPAAPGFRTLIIHGPTADRVSTAPVIAWTLGHDLTPAPITPSGVWDGVSNCELVQDPDGRVIANWGDTWPSIQAFLDDPEIAATRAGEAK